MDKKQGLKLCLAAVLLALAPAAFADINVGVIGSATGPGAAFGIDLKRATELMPASVGGQKVNVIFLDDATDPTTGARNARKLISERHIDALIGSNITASVLAMVPIAMAEKVPMMSMSPIDVAGDKYPWVFRTAHGVDLMIGRVVEHMVANKVKTVAFIGFSDAWGDLAFGELSREAQKAGIKIVANERYKRADASVTAQALKIVAAHPDAVMVGASGTPAVLPHVALAERGYKGKVYETHAVANKDFIRVGGKAVEGVFLPVGGLLVNEQLPAGYQNKAVADKFIAAYEAKFGPGSRSTFAGYALDGYNLFAAAMAPALKKGLKPGTPEFRLAIRDNLEHIKNFTGVSGVFNFSQQDHAGLDKRARVLARIENGKWVYVK